MPDSATSARSCFAKNVLKATKGQIDTTILALWSVHILNTIKWRSWCKSILIIEDFTAQSKTVFTRKIRIRPAYPIKKLWIISKIVNIELSIARRVVDKGSKSSRLNLTSKIALILQKIVPNVKCQFMWTINLKESMTALKLSRMR